MAADGASGAAAAAGLAVKLAPACVGALIMIAVGPKTIGRKEVFLRAFVALGMSYLFSDAIAAYAASELPWFHVEKHRTALDGLIGCIGWGLVGGISVVAQRFKRDPFKTVRGIKDVFRG